MPKHIAPPLLCRYEPGMKYGAHADAALIQVGNARIRSDLSCTVFIYDPATYEGGESPSTRPSADPRQGRRRRGDHLSVDELHQVVPVRAGPRVVSITFIESFVPDQHQRDAGVRAQRDRGARGHDDEMGEPRALRRRPAEHPAVVVDDVDRAVEGRSMQRWLSRALRRVGRNDAGAACRNAGGPLQERIDLTIGFVPGRNATRECPALDQTGGICVNCDG